MAGDPVEEIQRARIVEAMVSVAYEEGFAGSSVAMVCRRAQVSRSAFYEVFANREECFLAVIDDGYRRVSELIAGALERSDCWQDGLLGALSALLVLLDREPRLARVWLVESLAAGAWALERRERHVASLVRLVLARWPPPPGAGRHPLAATSVMGSAQGIVQSHLVTAKQEPLITLLGPLMGIATAPFLERNAVDAEVRRGHALAKELLAGAGRSHGSEPVLDLGVGVPAALRDPRAHRARRCLHYLAAHGGASNRQIAEGIGIGGHEQISRLLARLSRMGLLVKHAGAPGRPNSWRLTEQGMNVCHALDAISGNRSRYPCANARTVKTRSGHGSVNG